MMQFIVLLVLAIAYIIWAVAKWTVVLLSLLLWGIVALVAITIEGVRYGKDLHRSR